MKRFALLLGTCACSFITSFASTPSGCPRLYSMPHVSPWSWTDRNHKTHTRAELDLILANHRKWITKYDRYFTAGEVSEPKAFDDPLRADLSGADLIWADLRDADLSYADLSNARLTFADFTGASLYGASLIHSEGPSCLVKADVRFVDFTGVDLSYANLAGTRLYKTDLTGGVNLQGADLVLRPHRE